MSHGLIDSAGITSVIDCLHIDSLESASSWAYRTAVESTVALIRNDRFGLMPSPETNRESVGDFAKIQDKLALKLPRPFPSPAASEKATRKTNRWIRDHRSNLRQRFRDVYGQPDVELWRDHEVDVIWRFHAESQGALFNRALIPQLSDMLSISRTQLEGLHELSAKPKEVRRFVEKKPDTSDFRNLCKAYVGAFFLRGVYHDYIAAEDGHVVLPHRLRRVGGFLPKRTKSPIPFKETLTAGRLADLILRSARRERSDDRADAFAAYLVKGRERIEKIDLSPKSTKDLGEDATIKAARTIGLHTRDKRFFRRLDAGIALLAGGITSFTLSPYWGFAVGLGTWKLSQNRNLGLTVGEILDTPERLRRMMNERPAGRLEALWE